MTNLPDIREKRERERRERIENEKKELESMIKDNLFSKMGSYNNRRYTLGLGVVTGSSE